MRMVLKARAVHTGGVSSFIHTEADLAAALTRLIAADPRLAPILDVAGRPPLRRRPGGFEGLAAMIVSQQLSVASAAAIWGRLRAAFDPFHPGAVRRARSSTPARSRLFAPQNRTPQARAPPSGAEAT